jgi:hypothetical protein
MKKSFVSNVLRQINKCCSASRNAREDHGGAPSLLEIKFKGTIDACAALSRRQQINYERKSG